MDDNLASMTSRLLQSRSPDPRRLEIQYRALAKHKSSAPEDLRGIWSRRGQELDRGAARYFWVRVYDGRGDEFSRREKRVCALPMLLKRL